MNALIGSKIETLSYFCWFYPFISYYAFYRHHLRRHRSYIQPQRLTYAALDRDLNLIALADGEMEEVLSFLAAQKSATVAVNAPAGVRPWFGSREDQKRDAHQTTSPGSEYRIAEFTFCASMALQFRARLQLLRHVPRG